MDNRKVKKHGKRRIHIHNDLSNAAFHFKKSVDHRLSEGNIKGLTFDILAGIIMLAFSFEAKINFLGYKLIDPWNERLELRSKIKKIYKNLGINVDWNKEWNLRPFKTIDEIIKLRDSFAHGKPEERQVEEIIPILEDDINADSNDDLKSDCFQNCTNEFFQIADVDICQIWDFLLKQSGISRFETLTRSETSSTVINDSENSC